MKNACILLAFLALLPGAVAQEAPKQSIPGDAMELVFLGAKQPVLIRLHVLIDGKSVDACFNGLVEKWFRYLDVDNDGLLDAAELKRAPSAQAWLQMMRQGSFFPNQNTFPTLFQFGRKDEEKVTLPELQAYYRRVNQPLQLIPQPNNAGIYGEASNTLFKALDLNNDGKLSKEELLQARKTLRKFDLDDDELVSVQELAGNPNNPLAGNFAFPLNQVGGAAPPGVQISDTFFHMKPGENRLPMVLLALYDRDKSQALSREESGLDEATFAKLDANRDGRLDLNELAHWHERVADLEFTVNVGRDLKVHEPAKAFAGAVKESAPGVYQMALEDAQINLRSAQQPAGASMVRVSQAQVYLQQFRFADTKGQGYLEMKDLNTPQGQFMRQVFPYLDRDRDGKLTEKEVQSFVDLQAQNGDCAAFITLADRGRALFHLLDANGDGRLSQRELLNAWTRLAPLDKNKTGFVSATDVTRQFQFTVQRGLINNNNNFNFPVIQGLNMGAPTVPPPAYPKDVPAWFRKMDRNNDGDVSLAEFLGSRADFDRIDTDRDGLISAEEAIRYDAMVRPKK